MAKATQKQRVFEAWDQLLGLSDLGREFARSGKHRLYKQMSSTLRILLTGSSGQQGLIETILPNATLPPLRVPLRTHMDDGAVHIPAAIVAGAKPPGTPPAQARAAQIGAGPLFVGKSKLIGSFHLKDMFDSNAIQVPIIQWLDIPVLRAGMTLRGLIKLVANKDGGAHFDPNASTERLNEVGQIQAHLIAEMASIAVDSLCPQILAAYPFLTAELQERS